MERLAEGPIIGDGGFIFCLEKRGYCKAGPWTPEATVEYPEAVRQLHKEFLRAGKFNSFVENEHQPKNNIMNKALKMNKKC